MAEPQLPVPPKRGALPPAARQRIAAELDRARTSFFLRRGILGYGTTMALVRLVERFHTHGHTLSDLWSSHFAGHVFGAAAYASIVGLIFAAFSWGSHRERLEAQLDAEERFRHALRGRAPGEDLPGP